MIVVAGAGLLLRPERGRALNGSQPWLFVLFGPPVGAVLLLLVLGASPLTPALVLAALPVAYALGFLPALLVGALDRRLASVGRTLPTRLAAAAALGAAAGSLPLVPLYLASFVHGALPLVLPAIAAATSMICLGLHSMVEWAMRQSTSHQGPR